MTGVTSKTADCSLDTAFSGGWLVWPCCASAAGAAQGNCAVGKTRGSHAGFRHRLPDRLVRKHPVGGASLGVELRPIDTRDPGEIERAVSAFAGEPNGGLIVALGARVLLHRTLIVTLAARHRLPAVYPDRAFVAAGGLIPYGSDQVDQMRRAAGRAYFH